jgi:hypothetical protein
VHNNPLVEIRLAKDSMQSCDYRHAKMLQQLQDVISGFAAENSKLMLQADQIDVAGVQVFGGSSVGREVAFADLKSNPAGVRVGGVAVIDRYHRDLGGSVFSGDGVAQICRKSRNSTLPGKVIANHRNLDRALLARRQLKGGNWINSEYLVARDWIDETI